jgi:hypothetical protein
MIQRPTPPASRPPGQRIRPTLRLTASLVALAIGAAPGCGDDNGANAPPAFVTDPETAAMVYFEYAYELACADPDGDPVHLSVADADTCGGTLLDHGNRTGRYHFTPTPEQVETGCTLAVRCADGGAAPAVQSVAITVTPPPAVSALQYGPFEPWAEPLADYHEAAMQALGTRNFEWGIHDLITWQDRLYLGYGDATANVGRHVPIEVRFFTAPTPTATASAFTTDEEQIEQYRALGDRLVIPGVDATEDGLLGNVYTQDATGWTKRRSLQWAWHVHDVARLPGPAADGTDDVIYAVGSGGTLEDYNQSTVNAYLWRKDPGPQGPFGPGPFVVDTERPHPDPPGDHRLTHLLVAGGVLHAFGYYSAGGTSYATAYQLEPATGLASWDGLADFFVFGTASLSADRGVLWGVEIANPLRWGTRWLDGSGGGPAAVTAPPVASLAGLTILDAEPLLEVDPAGDAIPQPSGRALVLLLDGDDYPSPTEGPFDLSVAVLDDAGELQILAEQTMEIRPESVAFWRRHLYLGLSDGSLWRAEGAQ